MHMLLAVRDKGRVRFVHSGLVIVMYLITTSHLTVRWIFVRGGFIRHGETEEAVYNYFFDAPKWMLLSTVAFMANTLIADCIMVSGRNIYRNDADAMYDPRSGGAGLSLAADGRLSSFQGCAPSLGRVRHFTSTVIV